MSADAEGAERERAPSAPALLRLALVGAILVGERLRTGAPPTGAAFDLVLAAAAVYALGSVAVPARRSATAPWWLWAALDIGLLGLLAYESGGATSDLRWLLLPAVLGAALADGPRRTAGRGLMALVAYGAVALAGSDPPGHIGPELVLSHALYIAWASVAGIAIAARVERKARQVRELAASRGRLVAQALDAEDRERRRLGEALHDDALQNLLAVRQDLEEAEAGDTAHIERSRAALERTVAQLREAAFVLQSPVLQHLDVHHALDALAAQQARRGGFDVKVTVQDEAMGIDDQLMLSLSRELLVNAARHAGAKTVSVDLRRDASSLELEVRDDGRGFDEERRLTALRQGHIGLASSTERVEALGGRLMIDSRPGNGARILVSIPVTRERRRAPRPGGVRS